jgi:endonuclease/exonuclease/phosphatase family metal-dependent hydrolase
MKYFWGLRCVAAGVAFLFVLGCESTSPTDAVDVATGDAVADLAMADGWEFEVTADVRPDGEEEVRPGDASLVVMTFNVLCFFCDDKNYDPWEERLTAFADLFGRHDPDLIGLQELLFKDEVDAILAGSPGYEALYFQDDSQALFRQYADATILYRRDRFDVVENGFYWLSATPDVVLAPGWASSNLPRLVAWARLRDRVTGGDLFFSSTHFDNNIPNQVNSAPLYVERTRLWAERMPVVAVGDYNSKLGSPAYAILTAEADPQHETLLNSFDLATIWRQESNLDPIPTYDPSHRIDHIFVSGPVDWQVDEWIVDQWVYGDKSRYPSDHRAMVATLRYSNPQRW